MIDISKLYNYLEKIIVIDETISFNIEDFGKNEILEDFSVKVNGILTLIDDKINFDYTLSSSILLPCSITLEPVKYDINIKNNEIIEDLFINSTKTLDLKEFLWQNIVVEIPSKVVSENAYDKKYKGSGWELVDKDIPNNNPFSDLADIISKKG